jgi:hypothetical protein
LKKSTTICVVVLSLFLVAAFQIHGLESAIATDNGCLLWASTYLQDELSRERAEDAIDIIAYTFAQHDEVWTEIYDGYGSLTNLNNILSKCDDFEQYHNGVSFFHYGHWWTTQIDGIWYQSGPSGWEYMYSVPVDHWTYYDSFGTLVKDSDIFQHTDQGRHYAVLLWTCVNGYGVDGTAGYFDYTDLQYLPYYYYEGTGAVGMPYAFTHETDLRYNSTLNPDTSTSYCFIGFKGVSRGINETCAGTEFSYQYFICDYYYRLLDSGLDYSINETLDQVCDDIWETQDFASTTTISNYMGYNPFTQQYDVPSALVVWGNPTIKFAK